MNNGSQNQLSPAAWAGMGLGIGFITLAGAHAICMVILCVKLRREEAKEVLTKMVDTHAKAFGQISFSFK